MKRSLTFVAASAALAAVMVTGAARADGLYDPSYGAAGSGGAGTVTPSGVNWSGPYIGATLGYGWATANATYNNVDRKLEPSGGTGGVYGGYNFQVNPNFMLGAEGDFAFNGFSESANFMGPDATVKSTWQMSVRGRAGAIFDRVMVYGTGGVAFNNMELKAEGATNNQVATGWTIGGGVEGAVTQNITARAEYLYSSFDRQNFEVGTPASSDLTTGVLRAGVAYKF